MIKKLLMVFLIFNLIGCASNDEVDQSEIKAKVEQFVKDNLKVLGTVEFSSDDLNIYNDDNDDDSWTVIGYVDVENGSGTETSTEYTVNMTYYPGTQIWKLDKISFSNNSVEKEIIS